MLLQTGTIPDGLIDAMPQYGSYLDLRQNYMCCCGSGFQHSDTYSYVAYSVSDTHSYVAYSAPLRGRHALA